MNKIDLLVSQLGRMGLEKEAKDALLTKVSYLVNDMGHLKRYLTEKDGRGLEIAELNRSAFFDWLQDNNPEVLDSIQGWEDDPWGVDLSNVPEKILSYYLDSEWWRDRIDEVDLPSWDCMRYQGLIKDRWLIHFTDHAHAIAAGGFKYGVDDLSRLCLTTYLGEGAKKGGGFSFAFTADYKQKLSTSFTSKTGYGSEVVMFKANGIEVYHYGDEDYQVIFRGSTARNIIPIWEVDGGWQAGDLNKTFDSLEEIVSWIEANFDQYRRKLLS